jgi:threonyl-tRNA synthetase
LGAEHQKVMPLADAIAMLRAEGTPPDLKTEN